MSSLLHNYLRSNVERPSCRYAVQNMGYGWTLETITAVREMADCRGWFMNRAVDFSHTDEDLDDLVIGECGHATSL